jgi:hypothetical protein
MKSLDRRLGNKLTYT